MRYELPTDRLVNQLIPHYLNGRRIILFIQSILYPLKLVNDWFVSFAQEKQIESRMTSQVLYFEWFLNYKFKKYFVNDQEEIFIKDTASKGVALYKEISEHGKAYTLWFENEQVDTPNPDEEPKEFYILAEEKQINRVSFIVFVPEITISTQEFVYMLSFIVNTYKIAGVTYLIRINGDEFEPNIKAK